MVPGNEYAKKIIQKYFSNIESGFHFPFLILDGPQYIGKKVMIESVLQDFLGENFVHDYLPLYDLGQFLGKQHMIKISVPDKEQKKIHNEIVYRDFGVREIVKWLAISPFGKYKVVFLENIDRMTSNAMNAFLKTLEEPLSGRIIVATTKNREQLLDTIVSRAYVVRMHALSLLQINQYLQKKHTEKSQHILSFVSHFSAGRIVLAEKMLASGIHEEYVKNFHRLLEILRNNGDNVQEKYLLLKYFFNEGEIDALVDAILYSFSSSRFVDQSKIMPRIEAKKFLKSNVGADNVLFGLALS